MSRFDWAEQLSETMAKMQLFAMKNKQSIGGPNDHEYYLQVNQVREFMVEFHGKCVDGFRKNKALDLAKLSSRGPQS